MVNTRKNKVDAVNRIIRKLKRKGASDYDIYQTFGVFNANDARNIDTLHRKHTTKGGYTVVDGKIITRDFVKKFKALHKGISDEEIRKNYTNNRFARKKVKEFKTTKEIKDRLRSNAYQAKDNYVKQYERLMTWAGDVHPAQKKEFQKTLSKLKRMSLKRFQQFAYSPFSDRVGFEIIFEIDTNFEVGEENQISHEEILENGARKILKDISFYLDTGF